MCALRIDQQFSHRVPTVTPYKENVITKIIKSARATSRHPSFNGYISDFRHRTKTNQLSQLCEQHADRKLCIHFGSKVDLKFLRHSLFRLFVKCSARLFVKCSAPLAICYKHLPRVNKGYIYIFFFTVTEFVELVYQCFMFYIASDKTLQLSRTDWKEN